MAGTRRGRVSQASYRDLVSKALLVLNDQFKLDEFPVLSQLPAVEQWAQSHTHLLLSRGKGLHFLLVRAIAEVIERIGEEEQGTSRRIVDYLRMRYQHRKSVKAIAEMWGISVEQVWRSAGRIALDLVTEQFLAIARADGGNLANVQVKETDSQKVKN